MFQQGEEITTTKLKDIFMRMALQANSIDSSQIRAMTCGQLVGYDTVGTREYEGYSSCVDQYWLRPFQNNADYAAGRTFFHKFIEDIRLLKEK